MKDHEAYAKALQNIPREPDGGIDEKALIEEIAHLVDFDEDEERRKHALRVVRGRRKPGTTEAVGQLSIEGFDAFAYEPERLIADNDGHVIEQGKAPVRYKQAQAERTRETASRWIRFADRAQKETADFAQWVIEGYQTGRDTASMTFDHFVREAGLWSEEAAEPEPEPDDDDGGM